MRFRLRCRFSLPTAPELSQGRIRTSWLPETVASRRILTGLLLLPVLCSLRPIGGKLAILSPDRGRAETRPPYARWRTLFRQWFHVLSHGALRLGTTVRGLGPLRRLLIQ